MSAPKFTVAICGAGVGGLLAALALSHFSKERKDIKIDIYETKDKISEAGAGITFCMRPFKILERLGLVDDLVKITDQSSFDFALQEGTSLRKSNQEKGLIFYNMDIPMGAFGFLRSQFVEVLASHLDSDQVTIHFSKRLKKYKHGDGPLSPVEMIFEDGSTATADILIGADGINSAVRREMYGLAATKLETSGLEKDLAAATELRDYITPIWSGWTCYRCLVPRDAISSVYPKARGLERSALYCGKGAMIVSYPLQQAAFVYVSFNIYTPEGRGTRFEGKTAEEVSQAEVLENFQGWDDEATHIVKCAKNPTRWIVNTLKPLPTSVQDRVALLGDAAHAMTNGHGAGGGQACEDAYILASLLAHPLTTKANISDVLKVYESVRLPFANDIHRRSARGLELMTFYDPQFAGLEHATERDIGKLWDMGFASAENMKWAWTTDVEDDKDKARALLEEGYSKGST